MNNVVDKSPVANTEHRAYFGICWCCEKNKATRISSVPMGATWGFSPVELCSECDEELG